MKAVYINQYGGPEVLEYGDLPDPVAGRKEVLIRVAAASVNPVDWKVREGRLKLLSGKKFPLIMGTEVAGEVVSLGEDVSGIKVGERVFAGLSHRGGAYAELVSVHIRKVTVLPGDLSPDVASTLAVAGVTSFQAFTIHRRVRPGDEVLINGASGGVGMYAVQVAKLLGARVTAVCSERNASFVRELGADEVIDYTSEDFRDRHNAFDVILDAAANAFFPSARKCLKRGGILIKLNLSKRSLWLGLTTRFFSSRKLKMILLKNRPEDLQWMIGRIMEGKIKVHIERTYPLDRARDAQEYSQSGRARGKLVIKVPT